MERKQWKRLGNKCLMPRFVKQKSVRVTGVDEGCHISRVTSGLVWVSVWCQNLILTNTTGENLHHLTDVGTYSGGHTVNTHSDLIYIDREFNINKLSIDYKKKSTLIKYTDPWEPRCVYSSPSTGLLLVGMWISRTWPYTGKILRYNSTGENIQTIIPHGNRGQKLYSRPTYITESQNGDVIVSDFGYGLVVTNYEGKHRFSYTGPFSGLRLHPLGICTDALSHILVCDQSTNSVQMLDCDGNVLSQIQTSQQHWLDKPQSLSYDDKTNLLWVGSENNSTVDIYRCINGDCLAGLPKCKIHRRGKMDNFCVSCEVPLCRTCTSSVDHRRHDCRDVRKCLEEIHKIKDGNAVNVPTYVPKLQNQSETGTLD